MRVPGVVLEIVAGVVLGPSVLDWVRADLVVSIVAVLGLASLLFLAGLEIDTDGFVAQYCGSRSRGMPSHWCSASGSEAEWRPSTG